MNEVNAAALRFLRAEAAMHEVCSSTDVHHRGGMAGQAITPHCHWECNALEAKFNAETGRIEGEFIPFHAKTKTEYENAKQELIKLIGK